MEAGRESWLVFFNLFPVQEEAVLSLILKKLKTHRNNSLMAKADFFIVLFYHSYSLASKVFLGNSDKQERKSEAGPNSWERI